MGSALVAEYTAQVDVWIKALFATALESPSTAGMALVAVGGYGRGELAPHSDLDLLLVFDGRPANDVASVAQRLWYPIWDTGLKLGHAVRSTREALALAAEDIDTATALLDLRLLAGDPQVADHLVERARHQWQKKAKKWLGLLRQGAEERHESAGEVAFLLEPDLKNGRGGMRDVHTIRWAQRAGMALPDGDSERLDESYRVLLDARVELHRVIPRPSDVLLLQDQDAVAAALGDADADVLMARLSSAARTVAWVADEAWQRLDERSTDGGGRWLGGGKREREREVAEGVLVAEGEIRLDPKASLGHDPLLLLRVAVAAATEQQQIDRKALRRLVNQAPALPDPWPLGARLLLVELLGKGRAAIPVIESLDQHGLWTRVLPEWEPVRCKPQRNAYHRFTVDRHLCEAAANAAALVQRVERPDLLLIGALLHDIGKGYPGDHTVVGIDLVQVMGERMGYTPDDVDELVNMVRYHLLLPEVATRRDLDDDATITGVAESVGSVLTLELLGALTEADSLATGSSAWGNWKADLVAELVRRTRHVLGGGEVQDVMAPSFPTPEQQVLLDRKERLITGAGDELTVVAPDRPGLFSKVAGVLALHGLNVRTAGAHSTDDGMALEYFTVTPVFDRAINWDKVTADVASALDGRLAVQARLAERARTYSRRRRATTPHGPVEPTVTFDNAASMGSTVIEIHSPDGIGLLYRLTRAFAELDVDIHRALVQTHGENVFDVFYVRDGAGRKITDRVHQGEVERGLLHAIKTA